MRRIRPAHAAFARRLADKLGEDELRDTLETLACLSDALDALASDRS